MTGPDRNRTGSRECASTSATPMGVGAKKPARALFVIAPTSEEGDDCGRRSGGPGRDPFRAANPA